jgi:hypothetical protein
VQRLITNEDADSPLSHE